MTRWSCVTHEKLSWHGCINNVHATVRTRIGICCIICAYCFFHIAAVNTRGWIYMLCYLYLYFLSIRFQHRKRSSSYWVLLRGRVVWPFVRIHDNLLMCSHYARKYWESYFGFRQTQCAARFELVLTRRSVYCVSNIPLSGRWYYNCARRLACHHRYQIMLL